LDSNSTSIPFHICHAVNGDGVRGIVGDEKVCLLVARVFDDEGAGATYSAVAASIAWALDNNAKVINMSFGTATASTTIKNAVDRAAQEGSILVSSSGYV
jgi:subtilisin family serine protease